MVKHCYFWSITSRWLGIAGEHQTVCLVGERGEPDRSEPVPVAVWLEDERVGLVPGWNISLRCGLDSSVKIWRTEPLQPG